MEPIPFLAETLRNVRPHDQVVSAVITTTNAPFVELHVHEKNELSSVNLEHLDHFKWLGGREGIVETIRCPNMHINDFLKQFAPNQIDYLSIDVEGLDIELLREMDTAFQPTIIQAELGHRFDQIISLMNDKDYGLLAITDVNVIFLRRGIF